VDHYKIELSSGYEYTVTARVHDAKDSDDGNTYSVDVLFFSSVDNGGLWSDPYDDVMTDAITLEDGGTVNFEVVSFYIGAKGTYRLEINVSRIQNLSEPDVYEENNTLEQARELPLVFSEDAAWVTTTGSNLHTSTDVDHYKIRLPSGYEYTVNARVFDSKNSGDENPYSVDVLFFSSIDQGVTWSEYYDEVLTGNLMLEDGGTVNFRVVPYVSGSKGTYLLDIDVSRISNDVGIENRAVSDDIVIYPNPAQDHITISGLSDNADILLTDISGRIIYRCKSDGVREMQIPVSHLAEGMYFVRISTTTATKTMKLIKQ
jgi:hypothetical protein